ncbi:inosamine-phosphate amidinotransferase 1 [Streptomyces glaucescens]|uniref:inosamine-phosphate amidinotransferase 1 n=1 Tax=Streptomyces glaucescens TaxID=1907 RepID=UPI0034502932
MSLAGVYTEWDPLEEIVVGTAVGSENRMVRETEDELDGLCEELRGLGVTVRRLPPQDPASPPAPPDRGADTALAYRPRDGLLTVGETVIQTPAVPGLPSLQSPACRMLLMEYFTSGSRWISAPPPVLTDVMYDPTAPAGERLRELEPVFDSDTVLRIGTDLLYLVSDSGNALGARWLQAALGERYTVHPCRGPHGSPHGDFAVVPLGPGLILVNPERVDAEHIPPFLRTWKRIVCPELVDPGPPDGAVHSSGWGGSNILVVRPGLVIVDRRQADLMRVLENNGIDVLPLQLTHARALGSGFHRVTVDVRRTGTLESYRF